MIQRLVRLAALCTLVIASLAACGQSAPTQYYTLRTIAPSPGQQGSISSPPLRIARVSVAATVDRPELVRERAGVQLKVDDFSHWGAPLGQLLRATLVGDLLLRLPEGQVVPIDAPKPANVIDISVEILAIHEAAGGVSVDVSWTQTRSAADVGATIVRTRHFSAPLNGASNTAYVEALSQVTAQLADAIAQQIAAR